MYAVPVRSRRRPIRVPSGWSYLGEDDRYYYFSGPVGDPNLSGFFDNVSNMFTRMVKFTPKSFTPGNIYKGVVNTSLTTLTGGLYQVLPKNIKKSVYEAGKIAIPVVAGAVVAYTAGPAVMGVLQPKLQAAAALIGKHGLTIGGRLFDFLGKLGPKQQAQMAESITPQQIADMEQRDTLPADLVPMFNQLAKESFPVQATTGAAALYDPSAMTEVEMQKRQPVQAGAIDPSMLFLIGVPLAFMMFTRKR